MARMARLALPASSRPLRARVLATLAFVVLVLGASAGSAQAAGRLYTPLIHLNACDNAQRCAGGNAPANITAIVRGRKPELLTLNEICSDSVARIADATGYHRIFTQAGEARCAGGRGRYGNAILAAPQRTLTPVLELKYADQQAGPEKRMLTCADSTGALVCVTHLDHKGKAAEQAREMRRNLNALLQTRNPLMFVGADLNLAPAATRANALPAAMARIGDGRVMHVFYSRAFGRLGGQLLTNTLRWTDHRGLALRARAAAR